MLGCSDSGTFVITSLDNYKIPLSIFIRRLILTQEFHSQKRKKIIVHTHAREWPVSETTLLVPIIKGPIILRDTACLNEASVLQLKYSRHISEDI